MTPSRIHPDIPESLARYQKNRIYIYTDYTSTLAQNLRRHLHINADTTIEGNYEIWVARSQYRKLLPYLQQHMELLQRLKDLRDFGKTVVIPSLCPRAINAARTGGGVKDPSQGGAWRVTTSLAERIEEIIAEWDRECAGLSVAEIEKHARETEMSIRIDRVIAETGMELSTDQPKPYFEGKAVKAPKRAMYAPQHSDPVGSVIEFDDGSQYAIVHKDITFIKAENAPYVTLSDGEKFNTDFYLITYFLSEIISHP